MTCTNINAQFTLRENGLAYCWLKLKT